MGIDRFGYKEYRDDLASEILAEPDKQQRHEILSSEKETPQYKIAEALHNSDRVKQRLIEGGFLDEARAFEVVTSFAEVIKAAGGQALLVGGSVRDEIMGIPPKDYDIEVYGIQPDQLRQLSNSFGMVNEIGAAFGILKVQVGDIDIDVSLPRRESKTGNGHRDFSVSADPYMSIEEAARRRDFTFNALAKDILTGEIYDYFGGVDDIQHRILRITDVERFRDDPLRVLRGIQFIGRFGLKVDDDTSRIMREMRGELKHLPKERLREEWIKLFLRSRKPSLGLQAAMEWGIFHEMHPDVIELPNTVQEPDWHPEGNVWIHTLMVVDEAKKIVDEEQLKGTDALVVMLAAFCHDFGKPLTTQELDGRIRALGHEEAGAEPADKFLTEIGIEPSLRHQIANIVADHLKPSEFYRHDVQLGKPITDGAIKNLAKRIFPATLLQLVCVSKADHLGRGPFIDPNEPDKSFIPLEYPAGKWLLDRAEALEIFKEKPKPVLFGRDLIVLGFEPGPAFGQAIQTAEDMHIKGYTREDILSIIAMNTDKTLEEITKILEDQIK